jgi:hypothetical protein
MKDQDLVDIIVTHWKDNFTGLSALQLADIISAPHEDIVGRLRQLEKQGVVHLRETPLYTPGAAEEPEGVDFPRIPDQWKKVDTVIAFPNRSVLEVAFRAEGVDHGVFTNRLHKGDSQVRHYYFKKEVLDRYFTFTDKYKVRDDSLGGEVTTRSDYYQSLSEEAQDLEAFARVRYGTFKMADGTHGIGVIVKDLSELPMKEQQYWASFEVEAPAVAAEDATWDSYIRESFEGSWDEVHTDQLATLSETLANVNRGIGGVLFRSTSNPRLHHVVLDSVEDYMAAHKELYKLVGPDNMDRTVLEGELTRRGVAKGEMINESGRPKGAWALFRILCRCAGSDFLVFETIHANRQMDAHERTELQRGNEYYPEKWQSDTKRLLVELSTLAR